MDLWKCSSHLHELLGAPLGEGDPVRGREPVVGRVDPRDIHCTLYLLHVVVYVVVNIVVVLVVVVAAADVVVADGGDGRGQRSRLGPAPSPRYFHRWLHWWWWRAPGKELKEQQCKGKKQIMIQGDPSAYGPWLN